MHTKFCLENLKGGHHMRKLGIDVRIILKTVGKVGCENVEWIELAEARVHRHAFVNMVMNLLIA
jgi:hypothetical protein